VTEWFTKEPGSDVSVSESDPKMVIIAEVPDWVQLPPDLGGARVKVLGAKMAECPMGAHAVRHYELEGKVQVAECPAHGGFLWYSRKEST
jgi:hypothetical protein